MSCAGLVPVMELAAQTGLSDLLEEHVVFRSELIRSGAPNPAPKLTSIIAGMAAGADSIDDLDVIRAGGMKKLFDAVYAPATMGIFPSAVNSFSSMRTWCASSGLCSGSSVVCKPIVC